MRTSFGLVLAWHPGVILGGLIALVPEGPDGVVLGECPGVVLEGLESHGGVVLVGRPGVVLRKQVAVVLGEQVAVVQRKHPLVLGTRSGTTLLLWMSCTIGVS